MDEELYTPNQIRRWLGFETVRKVFELAEVAGVKPRLVSSNDSHRWVLSRDQVIKLLVAYYSKRGERVIHSSPKSAEE